MITTIKTALFIDTNILIYATHSLSTWQPIAIQTLHEARESNIDLTVSPQVLREYLAVATRDQSIPKKKFLNISTSFRENSHYSTNTQKLLLIY